ncbi:unnamed protein product, partial [Ilex paraguariensis]
NPSFISVCLKPLRSRQIFRSLMLNLSFSTTLGRESSDPLLSRFYQSRSCVRVQCSFISRPMAKEIMRMKPWIEVAPSPLVFPHRPSSSPKLETIREERAEGNNEDGE